MKIVLSSFVLAAALVTFSSALAANPPVSIAVGERPESVALGFDGDYFVTVMNGKETGDAVVKRIHGSDVSIFATGMDEPKGIAFAGNLLVCSDLKRVWKIDSSGHASILADESAFPMPVSYLNDVAAAPDGKGVYVTDMGDVSKMRDSSGALWPLDSAEAKQLGVIGRVYHIGLDGKVTIAIDANPMMPCPNGVGVDNHGQLLVGAFFTGNFLEAHGDHLHVIGKGFRGADAVEQHRNGDYFISSWTQGKAWRIDGKTRQATVLIEGLKSAADFYLDEANNRLLLPDMLAGVVYFVPIP